MNVTWGSDTNHDEKMSKEEAGEDLAPYFKMMDMNRDGFVDEKEAKIATDMLKASAPSD